ncbi:MAG: hypothetical protein GXY11_05010 [Clostridiales bacterium]|jgi:Flp pilus assembly protein TadG|nr:hypothetical protein [Clostridiales bacterium]
MKRRISRRYRRETGQSIVEAAYVIPLLILLLCGILDFGWIFANQLEVNNCSREGARFAVVNADDPDLSSLVTGRVASVAGLGDAGDITVDVDFVGSQDVRVSVIKRVQVLTPLAGIFVPDQEIDLESTTVMRIG